VIFPIFEARRTGAYALSAQRLRAEHVEDQAYAEELTEALMAIGHGAQVSNPEAVGFMLRGFFESTRRHVAFEREHVLPVIAAADSIGRSEPRAG
jgi:hemerythrin-like domain-containing protein